MCQDVAVVPFLWILPLSLYLITFIIAFDHARWYFRPFWIPLAAISIAALVYLLNQDFADEEMHLSIQIAIYATAMFAGCIVCHGEMVRLKPDPRYLTGFYLAVSLGGALGGVFVSLIAPRIFTSYWELHTGLVALVVLSGFCLFRDLRQGGRRKEWLIATGVSWITALLVMSFFLKNPHGGDQGRRHRCYSRILRGAPRLRRRQGHRGPLPGPLSWPDQSRPPVLR